MDAELGIGDPGMLFRDLDLGSRRSVAVAVSGGGDSMALLDLLDDHLRGLAAPPRLTAVTVDHGLRPGSAAEAAWVHFFCRERNIPHSVLRWEGEKPETGLPAAAREARYRLLAAAARVGESDILFTGHTLDDQIETRVMRSARSEQGRGLSGMAAATLFDRGTWIVRPLLNVRRAALRARLQGRGVPWIEDPTNDDEHYERVRVRKQAARAGDVTGPVVEIARAQAERRRTARAAARFVAERARRMPDRSLVIATAEGEESFDEAAITLALAALTSAVGGRNLPLGGRDGNRLFAFYEGEERGPAGGPPRMTLGRCVFEREPDGLRLWRERRNLPEIVVGPSESAVWDGRYAFSNIDPERRFVIGPQPLSRGAGRGAAAAEPAIRWLEDDGAVLPVDAGPEEAGLVPGSRARLKIDRHLPQFDHFLPEFDIVLADAVARLFGREPFPEPPVHPSRDN